MLGHGLGPCTKCAVPPGLSGPLVRPALQLRPGYRAPLYSKTLPPAVKVQIDRLISHMSDADLAKLARMSAGQAAQFLGIPVAPGLGELGWIWFVVMAAQAALAAKKAKEQKAKAKKQAAEEEKAAKAAAKKEEQAAATAAKETEQILAQPGVKRAADSGSGIGVKVAYVLGGLAIGGGILYLLRDK